MKDKITTGGNFPLPGQKHRSTIVLTQARRFGIDISTYMTAIKAFENVDFSQRSKLCDLIEDISMDAHLSSVISKRKSAVLCSNIEFQRDGKPDKDINEQLRSPWFVRFINDVEDSILKGSSLVQFFRDEQTGWIDYTLVPRKHYDPVRRIILRRQHDINGVPWDEYGNLLFIGEPRSMGELIKAAPWVIYKRNTTADWAQFAEIFGMPLRKYTYDPGDEEALEELRRNDEEQGSAASWFLPDGCNMELLESGNKTGSSDLYKALVDTCNNEMSKLILGNTLTTEAGDRGTQALGTVHNKVEERITQSDRKLILNVLNYDMADIFMNLGVDTTGGEFNYTEPKMTDPTTKIGLFTQASALGLEISKNQMYEELGLERPENEEDVVKRPEAASSLQDIGEEQDDEGQEEVQPLPNRKPTSRTVKKESFTNRLKRFFGYAPKNNGAPLAF